jgi:DNA repair exonuclease SbcCD nuclease subunit
MLRNFQFLVTSDTHVTATSAGRHPWMPAAMKTYMDNPAHNVKAVIVAGDITDGSDNPAETNKQCAKFQETWYEPLNRSLARTGGTFRASLGNHDAPRAGNNNPRIVSFVDDMCGGASHQSFNIGNVHFASVYLHPGHFDLRMVLNSHLIEAVVTDSLDWLAGDLSKHQNERIILFWHFNIRGNMSDWWGDGEKSVAYHLFKKYPTQIKQVYVGHNHDCQTCYWVDNLIIKSIPVSCMGGNMFGIGSVTANNIDFSFMASSGLVKTWDSQYQAPAALTLGMVDPVPAAEADFTL